MSEVVFVVCGRQNSTQNSALLLDSKRTNKNWDTHELSRQAGRTTAGNEGESDTGQTETGGLNTRGMTREQETHA